MASGGSFIDRAARYRDAVAAYHAQELDEVLSRHEHESPEAAALALFHRVAREVPAYGAFLREHGVEPNDVQSPEQFADLPSIDKERYYRRHPLSALCREGRLDSSDMLAMSSGSTGEPAVWPRFATDELATAVRFEQVLRDTFQAHRRSTLAVVCFALGTWVGGMYTAACLRHLAAKGMPLTVVTPGNQRAEILRVLRALGGELEQVVLFGYPPFLKDVLDAALADGLELSRLRLGLVMAGEVFSEEWRSLVCERIGARQPEYTTASLYGTADGGVLACETPLSIALRRALADRPGLARELFGEERLPTLCQYDPLHRFFQRDGERLLFTGDGGVPLIRYDILDRGGLHPHGALAAALPDVAAAVPGRSLPFVYVFGRNNFALSYYGANVYPENVALGVERREFAGSVSGKFVMQITADADQNPSLEVAVELAPNVSGSEALERDLALAIVTALRRVNSEFSNYTPAERQTPRVKLLPHADASYFPPGVKHRYSR